MAGPTTEPGFQDMKQIAVFDVFFFFFWQKNIQWIVWYLNIYFIFPMLGQLFFCFEVYKSSCFKNSNFNI